MILKFGHGFLVANEKQKDFLIGQLTVLGHAKKLDTVIVLPFGLPDRKPGKSQPVLRGSRIKETDFLLIWGGGIWDWFDPITLLHALAKIASQRNDIKTYFPGLMPPNPDSRKMAAVDHFLSEARRLGLLDTTLFVNTGWTSYDARGNYLLEADAGISLHRDSIEARFAFRTRILDYLWAGLPIVASKGDSWAEQIDANGLGITVPCENAEAVKHAILKMADDKVFRQQCKQRVLSLVPGYVWDNLVTRMNL